MSQSNIETKDHPVSLLLLLSLYVFEVSTALVLLGLWKKGSMALWPFLGTTAGIYFLAGALALIVSTVFICQQYVKCRQRDSRQFAFALVLNLMVVLPLFAVAETTVRVLSDETRTGPVFMNVRLFPRDWETEAQHYMDMLRSGKTRKLGIFAPDNLLGWTIAPNSESDDGRYANSSEGIRSAQAGGSLTDLRPEVRVALVGDSYTYAQDVSYELSWGNRLEQKLGSNYQVLNFGVPGFGVDQAYLRYQRDAKPTAPDIVVLAFIPHDLVRTMTVYSFIRFPEWESPYSKPRYVVDSGELRLLNEPLLEPVSIFETDAVEQLPLLEYEPGYRASEWNWRFFHNSYLVRFLTTKVAQWEQPRRETSGEALAEINSAVFKAFLEDVERAGSEPLILYLPAPSDFESDSIGRARNLLEESDLPYVDATPCLKELPPGERFVSISGQRGHFTPAANQILADLVHRKLTDKSADFGNGVCVL